MQLNQGLGQGHGVGVPAWRSEPRSPHGQHPVLFAVQTRPSLSRATLAPRMSTVGTRAPLRVDFTLTSLQITCLDSLLRTPCLKPAVEF